jgi:hypothetical protein
MDAAGIVVVAVTKYVRPSCEFVKNSVFVMVAAGCVKM